MNRYEKICKPRDAICEAILNYASREAPELTQSQCWHLTEELSHLLKIKGIRHLDPATEAAREREVLKDLKEKLAQADAEHQAYLAAHPRQPRRPPRPHPRLHPPDRGPQPPRQPDRVPTVAGRVGTISLTVVKAIVTMTIVAPRDYLVVTRWH